MKGFMVVSLVSLVFVLFVFAGTSESTTPISSKEVLSLICPAKLTTSSIGSKKELVCPVCPKFTSSAGQSDDLSILQILEGNFLPGQRLIFVRYSGCEPRYKNFGGSFLISKKDNQNQVLPLEDEFGDLGDCKVSARADRDILICGGFQCKVENNLKLNCVKQKKGKK